ncbi:MAG: imidazoleglycerol-phosphate dehydratase [Gemmatimonadaceae bacterium]
MSHIERVTRESRIDVDLSLAAGAIDVVTGRPFLTHMLQTLARYAGWSLHLRANGDLAHHEIEDTAIALGAALRTAAPAARQRYAHSVVPMDDALVEVAVDAGDRFYYRGPLPSSLYHHWMRSFAEHAGLTLHVTVRRGQDRHHIVEAAFKALGLALSQALRPVTDVVSTKGAVELRIANEVS